MQIPYGKGLIESNTIKQVTIRIVLKGASKPEIVDSIVMFDEKNWNFAVKIPLRNELVENVNDGLQIMLYKENKEKKDEGQVEYVNEFSEELFLGEVKVLWKNCLAYPLKWHISYEF